eukprot:5439236-Pyramimonas_sp.AAC.1
MVLGLPDQRGAGRARGGQAATLLAHGRGIAGQSRLSGSLGPAADLPRGRARARSGSACLWRRGRIELGRPGPICAWGSA